MRSLIIIAAVAAVLSCGFFAPAPAQAKAAFWVGRVSHVSINNVKVVDATGKELSFIILPKFKNLFSEDGKTTYQQASLHNGMRVKVVYDQKVLGARHADKIYILDPHGYPLKRL